MPARNNPLICQPRRTSGRSTSQPNVAKMPHADELAGSLLRRGILQQLTGRDDIINQAEGLRLIREIER